MSEHLSMTRLMLLLRSNLITDYRSWLTIMATVAGVIFITALFPGNGSSKFYLNWFAFILFAGGLIMTSRAFHEMHDKTRNEAFLLTPASSLEKTIIKLFTTTAIFILSLILFVFIVSVIISIIKPFLLNNPSAILNPFNEQIFQLIPKYLFVQSLYFLGAAWFKKIHFIKTTFMISAIVIALLLITIISIKMFFGSFQTNINFDPSTFENLGDYKSIALTLYYGLAYLIPATCWLIAWFRVNEVQVSNGV